MTLLLVVLALGVLAALVVAGVMTRWPVLDPAAPKVKVENVADQVHRHPRLAAFARSRLDPKVATGFLLSVASIVLAVGIATVGVLLLMVRTHSGFARFDSAATRFGATHAAQPSLTWLRLLTQLGGAVWLAPIAIAVALSQVRRSRPWMVLAFLVMAVGGQFLVANFVKSLVHRARPDLMRLTGFSGPSFPSGHAVAAAASFAAFALVIGRGRSHRVRTVLAAAAVGVAVAVAATRVLLGVHWLTDVLAGLAMGWAWFALCSIAFGGRLLSFGQPVAVAERVAPEPDAQHAPLRS